MDLFTSLFNNFAEALTKVLPLSPFKDFLSAFADIPYLGWLNWFVPFKAIIVIMMSWLGAIALFYLYSIVMRWLKVIGD